MADRRLLVDHGKHLEPLDSATSDVWDARAALTRYRRGRDRWRSV